MAQGEIAAAQAENDEALRIAAEIELREIQLKASLRAIELRLRVGEIDRGAASAACVELLEQSADPGERAEIAHALWGLSGLDDYRAYAAERYAELYDHTPSAEYRERYRELGGADLPAPPPLPAPLALLGAAAPIESLIARARELA
jgi:hypothetical protein